MYANLTLDLKYLEMCPNIEVYEKSGEIMSL